MPQFSMVDYERQGDDYLKNFLTDEACVRDEPVEDLLRHRVFTWDKFLTIAKNYRRPDNGKTILHILTAISNIDLVTRLLKHDDLNPFIPDSEGVTAFDIVKTRHPHTNKLIRPFVQNHCCINVEFNFRWLSLKDSYVTGNVLSTHANPAHIFDETSLLEAQTVNLTRLKYRLIQFLQVLPYFERKSTPSQYNQLKSVEESIIKLLVLPILKDIDISNSKLSFNPTYVCSKPQPAANPQQLLALPEDEEPRALIRIPVLTEEGMRIRLSQLYKEVKRQAPFVTAEQLLPRLEEQIESLKHLSELKHDFMQSYLKKMPIYNRYLGKLNFWGFIALATGLIALITEAFIIFTFWFVIQNSGDITNLLENHAIATFLYNLFIIGLETIALIALAPIIITCIIVIIHAYAFSAPNDDIYTNFKDWQKEEAPFNNLVPLEEFLQITDLLQLELSETTGLMFSDGDGSSQINCRVITKWSTDKIDKVEKRIEQVKTKQLTQCSSTLYFRAPPLKDELMRDQYRKKAAMH